MVCFFTGAGKRPPGRPRKQAMLMQTHRVAWAPQPMSDESEGSEGSEEPPAAKEQKQKQKRGPGRPPSSRNTYLGTDDQWHES